MTWHPLLAAIETCLTSHQIGTTEPVTPAPWMSAAADQIATAIIQHTNTDQARHIAALIELGVTA